MDICTIYSRLSLIFSWKKRLTSGADRIQDRRLSAILVLIIARVLTQKVHVLCDCNDSAASDGKGWPRQLISTCPIAPPVKVMRVNGKHALLPSGIRKLHYFIHADQRLLSMYTRGRDVSGYRKHQRPS